MTTPVDPADAAWEALRDDPRLTDYDGERREAFRDHRPLIEAALAARPAPPPAAGELREAAAELSDFLYDGIGWIERGPTGMSVADGERLEQLGDRLRAALSRSTLPPAAGEPKPCDCPACGGPVCPTCGGDGVGPNPVPQATLLAKVLGDWVRTRNDRCLQPSPCDHDRALADVLIRYYNE